MNTLPEPGRNGTPDCEPEDDMSAEEAATFARRMHTHAEWLRRFADVLDPRCSAVAALSFVAGAFGCSTSWVNTTSMERCGPEDWLMPSFETRIRALKAFLDEERSGNDRDGKGAGGETTETISA